LSRSTLGVDDMQFSSGPYYNTMDREYQSAPKEAPTLERPIVPINELGVTVPERHPVTGGNIIQNVESSIRMGASKMQIVLSTNASQPSGGGPKLYGEDVRESLRELARANNVMIEGVELPTNAYSNLSGFDHEQRMISESKRQRDLHEVKEAIKFVGDIAGGGGVDIWSQEFMRGISDAPWNKDQRFEAYEGEERYATEYLVDKRTGQIMQEIKHSSDIFTPVYKEAKEKGFGVDRHGNKVEIQPGDWLDMDGKWIDPRNKEDLLHRVPEWDAENKKFRAKPMPWTDIVESTKKRNERFGLNLDPSEFAFQLQLENKWIQARGSSLYYTQAFEENYQQREALQKALEQYKKIEATVPPGEAWRIMHEDSTVRHVLGGEFIPAEYKKPTEIINESIQRIDHHLKHVHEAAAAADAQAEEVQKTMDEVASIKKYAKDMSVKSYAEAGIAAMDETRVNKHVERPIHVGPEIGWPTAYGGHPEEFIELIKSARNEMAERLVKERGFSRSEAEQKSKTHISGCFDTGHLGMWLQHFKKEDPHESEEHRRARFNNWYMDMVKRMQKEDVIGSIQAVDSAAAGHAHLPPGQGIFPVIEAVDYLKTHGFTGFIVSEGHEEEHFGQGRILLQTWRAFGSDISGGYFGDTQGSRWANVADSYFGHANPPPYIVGEYRPGDDWVFWSGVQLE
jgi:hypothetical protein